MFGSVNDNDNETEIERKTTRCWDSFRTRNHCNKQSNKSGRFHLEEEENCVHIGW